MRPSRSASKNRDTAVPAQWTLTVELCWPLMAARYHRPGVAESFPGPRSMDDLPLYLMARSLLRRGLKRRGREFTVRQIEPPPEVSRGLAHTVPQFFLRNVGRVERPKEDSLPFEALARAPAALDAARAEVRRYRPPALLRRFNIDDVVWLRALLRRVVFEEDWRRRFGRELKERVRGPLFRYDPDASPPD